MPDVTRRSDLADPVWNRPITAGRAGEVARGGWVGGRKNYE